MLDFQRPTSCCVAQRGSHACIGYYLRTWLGKVVGLDLAAELAIDIWKTFSNPTLMNVHIEGRSVHEKAIKGLGQYQVEQKPEQQQPMSRKPAQAVGLHETI